MDNQFNLPLLWSHWEENRTKYIIALAAVATVGGCYYFLSQQNSQSDDSYESHMKRAMEQSLSAPVVSGGGNGGAFPIQVFVRIRPMVGKEIEEKHESLEFETKNNSLILNNVSGRDSKDSKKYKGFKNLVLPEHDNYYTFTSCIIPYLPNMLSGESTCVFAYGHTGSGKTHTIFGYGKQHPGMYQLFARALFFNLNKLKKSNKSYNDVSVLVRFTELYQGKAYDLLSKNKVECFIREGEDGDVQVRANPVKSEKDEKIRQYPVTSFECKSEEDLLKAVKKGVDSRNVGKSTLHDKSSRSHAFLEFEIVSEELKKKRNGLVEMEAEILYKDLQLVDQSILKKLKKKRNILAGKIDALMNDENRKYIGGRMLFIDLAGNEYGRDVVSPVIEENLPANATERQKAEAEERIKAQKEAFTQEQRERNEINQSLLSLKECIRGLHERKKHVSFRNSKLTLFLKPFLKGETSKAIMISNIGSSKNYTKQTINTLKYTQLVAQA